MFELRFSTNLSKIESCGELIPNNKTKKCRLARLIINSMNVVHGGETFIAEYITLYINNIKQI
ncbi:hypothetical protein BLOT_007153 [Blomia tropicalis]|nr:hypothetical protein BLOT_007153 [Blomia tropicalis]